MRIKKAIYIAIGCLGLGLGAVAAVIPLLPSFPFLMLALICFGRSSERLHRWFIGSSLYKNNLESFVQGRGMTVRAKIRLMVVVTITMAIGFVMMGQLWLGRIVLALVWLFHILYFTLRIRTLPREDDRSAP